MFQLVSSLGVSASNKPQLITGISNPDVLIAILSLQTFQSGSLIEPLFKSGNVFRIRWVQNGIYGNLISMGYGSREILLDVPFPMQLFDIEIIPSNLQFEYSIEISIRVFNPIFNSLAEKLGIPLDLLTRIPQQTLQILFGIDLEMSTDIRATKAALADIAATNALQAAAIGEAAYAASQAQTTADNVGIVAATNAADILAALGTIETNRSQSMQKFGPVAIAANEFSLNSFTGFYEHYLTHNLDDEIPEVEVYDSQRDKQLIQPTGVDANSVKLELTADDIATNSWPLYAIAFGKPGSRLPVAPVAPVGTELQSGFRATLANQTLSIFGPDGTLVDTSDPDIVGAYFRGGDRIYVSTSNGLYGYITYPYESGVTWTEATEADYQLAVNTGSPI